MRQFAFAIEAAAPTDIITFEIKLHNIARRAHIQNVVLLSRIRIIC